MGTLTIQYDVPGMSERGQLLEEIVLRPTVATDGVSFIADSATVVPQRTYETIARATHRIAKTLALPTRSLTVRCISRRGHRSETGYDCSTDGDAVLDVAIDGRWVFDLWLALVRASDLLSGRFPTMHAAARVSWIDILWTLSLEGRLAARGVVRSNGTTTAAVAPTAESRARNELRTALIWAGKQRGLSLLRVEAERIATAVWGKEVSLHELVELGEKFGFRREGPLSSIPLPEIWPRQLRDARKGQRVGGDLAALNAR